MKRRSKVVCYAFKDDTPKEILIEVALSLPSAEAQIFKHTLCCLARSTKLLAMQKEVEEWLIK